MLIYEDLLRAALGSAIVFTDNDEMVIMEITERCVAPICKYCYKSGIVGCNKPHVPKETVVRRLRWIKTFTNAKGVTFLGGEPLLVPYLKELIDEALDMGLAVNIITAGKIVDEYYCHDNIKMIAKYWATGKIGLSLSYHPGNNEEFYFSFLEKLKEVVKSTARPVADLILRSTATFDEKNSRSFLEKFRIIFDRISRGVNYELATLTGDGKGDVQLLTDALCQHEANLKKHFQFPSDFFTRGFNFPIEVSAFPFAIKLKIWGSNEVRKDGCGHYLARVAENWSRKGNDVACSAMFSQIKDYRMQVMTNGLSVASDGGLTFSSPQCFAGKTAKLGYIEKMSDRVAVYETVSQRVERIRGFVIRAKAVENRRYGYGPCKKDSAYQRGLDDGSINPAYHCYSCSLGGRTGACTVCANTDFEK